MEILIIPIPQNLANQFQILQHCITSRQFTKNKSKISQIPPKFYPWFSLPINGTLDSSSLISLTSVGSQILKSII